MNAHVESCRCARTIPDVHVYRAATSTSILNEEGLTARSLPRLGKEIGLTHQAIAQRFRSKNRPKQDSFACFVSISEDDIRHVRDRLESPLSALRVLSLLPPNPNLALRHLDKSNLSWVLFWLGLQRDPDQLLSVSGQNGRFSHALIELLHATQLAGEIRPCDSPGAVEVILAIVTGAALR